MPLPIHLYIMAAGYILAGLNHFRNPRMYLRIIPPYIPEPKAANYLSGAFEIVFGILLCIPATTSLAAYGIILLLIAVLPANVYMFTTRIASFGLPKAVLLFRLFLQPVLICWAFQYTGYGPPI